MTVESVVTYLFLDDETSPAPLLSSEPKADRGYARKFLAQMFPGAPISSIGQFPLNRSTPASRGEFYIAGHPGLVIVQTVEDLIPELSQNDSPFFSHPAADVIVTATATDTDPDGFGGYAHLHQGNLKRSLSGTRTALYENFGIPDSFEAEYWAGNKADSLGGISLPFRPKDLSAAAAEAWLGVEISPHGPDIDVAAFATDGRPEVKIAQVNEERVIYSPHSADEYDDYEAPMPDDSLSTALKGISSKLFG